MGKKNGAVSSGFLGCKGLFRFLIESKFNIFCHLASLRPLVVIEFSICSLEMYTILLSLIEQFSDSWFTPVNGSDSVI